MTPTQILDQAQGNAACTIALISDHGGAVIPACQNDQPDQSLKIASVRFGGFVGIGRCLLNAAEDWTSQAREANQT